MEKEQTIQAKINNTSFTWDTERGIFRFDGADVVLFWIESAFKTLLDTIEEVSGQESATVVLETAGYRMGEIVAGYYQTFTDIGEVIASLPGTYTAAGWGKMTIDSFDQANRKAVVRMENSWEYRVNRVQEKQLPGSFLAGHLAGIFTGLFKENMWYRTIKSQLLGDEYDEFEIFASIVTPASNIHDLIRQTEQHQIKSLEEKVAERTKELNTLIQDLSVPVIPVLDNVLVIPLIAKYDAKRAEELMEKALFGVTEHQAKYLILDLTGLKGVDEYTIALLHKLVQSTALVGATCILVGISPELSVEIVNSNFSINEIICFSTLQHGIYYALAQDNLQILKKS
ncbi:STAS domain-containing protein [Aneurinibacillus tyrosinisolvens]|uniref:STAS domain-containing protein n=1 Tax=Aneurinibacillus tyrosinisolvens TaxID=1443435 RepID=UPI00063F0200|nr:STAS domain-containing protein [Aneurinibacillus tyrosinisolvens]